MVVRTLLIIVYHLSQSHYHFNIVSLSESSSLLLSLVFFIIIIILLFLCKVVWYSKLLGKDKNSYCRQIFDKEWGKRKLRGRRRKQWKKCVMDIISDMTGA